MMKLARWCLPVLLLAACSEAPEPLLGTVEWDRLQVLAEVSEPVVELAVKEGQSVEKGELLLRLDPRRVQAQLDEAQAQQHQARARLSELRNGAREETVAAARAELEGAVSREHNARLQFQREQALFERGTIPRSQLDNTSNQLRTASAEVKARRAQLSELVKGTRLEALEQGEAALEAANARVAQLQRARQRLDVVAPVSGQVDSLPHRLGDQPRAGDALVALLAGETPYARVFVPESRRAATREGDRYRIQVDGIAESFEGVIRSVRSDPAFTPYYALSGDDASRLVYQAEIILTGEAAKGLPAGLPCQAWPLLTEDKPHAGP